MCGINGIFLYDKPNINTATQHIVQNMNNAMEHRGPDAEGIETFEHIVLGHRRLSIIDINTCSNQPMVSQCKQYAIVFNGEIYNYKTLRKALEKTFQFVTDSDTEVLLNAYILWGKDLLSKIKGMFAFAIWNTKTKECFLARDHIGIKPLYFYNTDDFFAFSSSIKSLLKIPSIEKKLNTHSLAEFLHYRTVHAPNTIIKDVYLLQPGYCISVNQEDIIQKCYWNPSHIQTSIESHSQAKHDIRELLINSVEQRLVADVPVGAFLSGGIDSSILVCIASKILNKTIDTYSFSFEEKTHDESEYAEHISQICKTNHHTLQLSSDDILQHIIRSANTLDHPSVDGINTYCLAQQVHDNNCKVILSGLGGDELFAGYPIFRYAQHTFKTYQWLDAFPHEIKRLIAYLITRIKSTPASFKLAEIIKEPTLHLNNYYKHIRQSFSPRDREELLGYMEYNNPIQAHIEQLNPKLDLISKVSWLEIATYLSNVLLRDTDQMSMLHSLEVRVPFMDVALIEKALSIQGNLKLQTQKSYNKPLLVDTFSDILPKQIYNRPKMGFNLPFDTWLRGELLAFATTNLNNLKDKNIFDSRKIDTIQTAFFDKQQHTYDYTQIYSLIILNQWMETNSIIS